MRGKDPTARLEVPLDTTSPHYPIPRLRTCSINTPNEEGRIHSSGENLEGEGKPPQLTEAGERARVARW